MLHPSLVKMSMSTLNKLYLALLTLLSVACTSTQATDSDSGECIKFSMNQNDEIEINLDISFYQPEEIKDNPPIGSISMVYEDGDNIYIGDDTESKLLKYDHTGNFICKIGELGQGAGEYVQFSYFFINHKTKLIGILDEDQQKIFYYSLDNAEFKKSESYPQIASNCCLPVENCIMWYNQNYETSVTDKYFVMTDAEGEITKTFINKEFITGYSTGSSCPLFNANGKIYGYTPYDLKLYEFDDNEFIIKYNISIQNFNSPTVEYLKEISKNGTSVSLFSNLSNSDFISYFSIEMCPSLMVINVIRNKEKFIGLFDIKSRKTTFQPLKDFSKKIGVCEISYFIQNTIDDSILCVIEKENLIEYIAESGNEIDSRLKTLAESDNENPIIVKIKAKE